MRFWNVLSAATTVGLVAAAVWCLAEPSRAQRGGGEWDPKVNDCSCNAVLGGWQQVGTHASCYDHKVVTFNPWQVGRCNTGHPTCQAGPSITCRYLITVDLYSTTGVDCCLEVQCGSPPPGQNPQSTTCGEVLNFARNNWLDCGGARQYRIYTSDTTVCPDSGNDDSCNAAVAEYVRVNCVPGGLCQ